MHYLYPKIIVFNSKKNISVRILGRTAVQSITITIIFTNIASDSTCIFLSLPWFGQFENLINRLK